MHSVEKEMHAMSNTDLVNNYGLHCGEEEMHIIGSTDFGNACSTVTIKRNTH